MSERFPENMYEVSVIIPNFNGKKYLKDCLDALLRQDFPSFEIVVVDNGSKDGSVQYLGRNYPQVRLIALEENTGFCGAVNVGIHTSQAKYILLLIPSFRRGLFRLWFGI